MTNTETNSNLSPDGLERRNEMLGELQREVGRVKQSRNRKSVLASVAILGLALATVWVGHVNDWWQTKPIVVDNQFDSENDVQPTQIDKAPETKTLGLTQVSLEIMSDEELLEALAELGQPSAIANIGGEEVIVSQIEL